MSSSYIAILLLVLGHIICSGIAIYDLFSKSKRRKKSSWLAFLIFVPYLSVFIYSATKRRPGRPASPTKINA